VNKQGFMTLRKVHNFSSTQSKGMEMDEMPNKEFKSPVLKMINDLKED
jgi:hypothetical protein